ncbi:MAG TPA: hypothetical protein VMV24_00920 [Candidatus Dormibacteraeota bacterium]|nr:hypothetical protein [Candidatus Dormibacteraeota bacterium]
MVDLERFISGPGDLEPQEKMGTFFDSVLNDLNFSIEERLHFCKIRSREIVRENDDNQPNNATDDRVTELIVHGITVAMRISIRDDFNFTQEMLVSFLSPELYQELRSIY